MARAHVALMLTAVVLLSGCAARAPSVGRKERPLPDPAATTPVKVIGEITAPGGLAIDRDGNIYFANYVRAGTIGRLRRNGNAEILADLAAALPREGDRGVQPAGITIDDRGNLIVADAGLGQILRVSADGRQVDVLARELEGERIAAVTDVAVDRGGSVYFTAPGEMMALRLKPWSGHLMVMNPEPMMISALALAPDGRHCAVIDTEGRRVALMDLAEGVGRNVRMLREFPRGSEPRGLAFDEAGRLYVASSSGDAVHVLETPSGRLLASYPLGAGPVSRLHFHGGDLYVTAGESLWKLPLGVRGVRYSQSAGY